MNSCEIIYFVKSNLWSSVLIYITITVNYMFSVFNNPVQDSTLNKMFELYMYTMYICLIFRLNVLNLQDLWLKIIRL